MERETLPKLSEPVLYLAPLSGITDKPFRLLCYEFGGLAGAILPMIGARALLDKGSRAHTLKLLDWEDGELNRGLQVQIFGGNQADMVQACKFLMDRGCKAIDLNLGCQVPKVLKNGGGAAWLRDLDSASRLLEACAQACQGMAVVTVKMRLGWDHFNVQPFLKRLRDLGAVAVFMHGRLAVDKFSGTVSYAHMRLAGEACSVPFYANGDITDHESAENMLRAVPKAQGLMLGRGALGHPDVFARLNNSLKSGIQSARIESQKLLRRHLELVNTYLDESELSAVRKLRRHLPYYDCTNPAFFKASTFKELFEILDVGLG